MSHWNDLVEAAHGCSGRIYLTETQINDFFNSDVWKEVERMLIISMFAAERTLREERDMIEIVSAQSALRIMDMLLNMRHDLLTNQKMDESKAIADEKLHSRMQTIKLKTREAIDRFLAKHGELRNGSSGTRNGDSAR